MATTILDVAKLCGYSKATVSRAFASPDQVAEKTRQRVYEAARTLNYTPDAIARAMVRGRTDNIGFYL
jgi:DNA-binding LacI/PurR family transcriptional regulator